MRYWLVIAISVGFLLSILPNIYAQENISSPLKQFKSGITANVKCQQDLQLVLKAEDYTPACLKSETATKLIQRGWALETTSLVPFIKKMDITGLQQTYTVGQPINATVKYVGYYWYAEPDVKILDVNGTQIWFNCAYCYARSEAIQSPSLGTFAYYVRDYSSNNPPIINETGTYTMVASLENKTAEAKFEVIYPITNKNQTELDGIIEKIPPQYKITVNFTEGQRYSHLLVQKIYPDHVDGLNFYSFPVASNRGFPVTLHVGDTVSNGCYDLLTLIQIQNKIATFSEILGGGSSSRCPICMSGKTNIDTPDGPVNIKQLKSGMSIWTQDNFGHRQSAAILKTSKTLVPYNHEMMHLVLSDGRELFASVGHPTIDDRFLGELKVGDTLDNSKIKSVDLVPYDENYTYDILPTGSTGFYWANGILVGSTLK